MGKAERLGGNSCRAGITTGAGVLLSAILVACGPAAQMGASAKAPANLTGIWVTPGKTVEDGPATGHPVNLGVTPWALLSAGPPEQQKLPDFDAEKALVAKIISNGEDPFPVLRARAFRPPLTDAGMAAQKAAAEARAKEPHNPYAQCMPQNSIGVGNTVQIFQTEKRVVIVPEKVIVSSGFVRAIMLDGEAGRENSVASYVGYSSGRWEGKSLVVTTTNFLGETINGWPASDQAKVEETYTLSGDGNRLSIKTIYSDPVNLKEPVAHMTYMDRRPEDTMLIEGDCVESIVGSEEFIRLLGNNYGKGALK